MIDDLKKEIGTRIKQCRKEKGMTQRSLGEKVGCHEGTIRQYENGLREPKKVSRLAIARALDVPYDRLFPQYGDYATNINVATKDGTNLASLGTDVPDINVGELISRQQAIDTVRECYDNDELFEVYEWKLNELPPAEQKRGKWIEDRGQQTLMQNFIAKGEVWRVCSVCGAGHMIGHKYECDKAYHETYHNFCPNCGARMEVTT